MNFDKPIEISRKDNFYKNYFEVYSKKLNRIVRLFSSLRYATYLTLEMDPTVKKFCERPLEIEIMLEEKMQKTFIDFWLNIRTKEKKCRK